MKKYEEGTLVKDEHCASATAGDCSLSSPWNAPVYRELPGPFDKEYDSWVIAYCVDSDEFFITRQRGFFWQDDKTYKNLSDAINAFESNIKRFVEIKNDISSLCIYAYKPDNRVWLSNTNRWYSL